MMRSYRFLSKAEQHEKALANWNPEIKLNMERDMLMNQVTDTEIMYLVPQVKIALKEISDA